MELNIYSKGKVIKTYQAETYELPWGVVTDVTSAIDIEKLANGGEDELYTMFGGLLLTSAPKINDLMMDIFDGLTEEELRKASAPEIIECLVDVVIYTFERIENKMNGKNLRSRMTGV